MRRLRWTVLGLVLVAAVLAMTGAAATSEDYDLTGTWRGTNDGSTYVIVQKSNDTVFWEAHASNNTSWCHRFSGRLTGNVVEGDFVDYTRCGARQQGHIRLRVLDEDHMKLVYSSVGFGTQGWERVGGTWPPKLPDATVAMHVVSNGCGGSSWFPFVEGLQNWLGNSATFTDPDTGERYLVNFKPACDLHDAGYSGAKVVDALNGNKVIDYFGKSRLEVDEKFRADLRKICARTITNSFKAANNCMSYGGFANFGGAQTLYEVVRKHAEDAYWKRPDLDGIWADAGSHMPKWRISMNGRNVSAGFGTPTGWRGEFRGRLISYDNDGVVRGWIRMEKRDQTVKGTAMLKVKFVKVGEDYTHFQIEYFVPGGRVSGTMQRES